MERRRNFEVIWLLRSLKPDFKTIADFRRDNRAAFRSVFHQFALLCRRLDLPRDAGRGQNPHQGGQQQGPETQNSLNKFIRAADRGWIIICGGSTTAMSRKAEQAAARARSHISPSMM